MTQFAPFAIALRLSGVSIDQHDLDMALKQLTSRYEPEDADNNWYAQVDLDTGNPVRAVLELAERSGPAIEAMLEDRRLGRAVLVLAFDFPEVGESMSTRLPTHLAAAVGVHGIEIEISVYLTDVEEEEE